MSITLPTRKGEIAVVWHRFENDAEGPVRVILVSNGNGRWEMRTEGGDPYVADGDDVEEYEDGKPYRWTDDASCANFVQDDGAYQRALSRVLLAVGLAMRGSVMLRPAQQVDNPSILGAGDNVVSRTKGNRQLVVTNEYGRSDGWFGSSVRTNKPLDAGEWLAALENLALALDAFDRHFEA